MRITPLILGKGNAGLAVAKALQCLELQESELGLTHPVWLERGASLAEARRLVEHPLLVVTNPHGLHAETLLEAERAGFTAALCEKPLCVNAEQARALRSLKMKVGVFHGYRLMWGPQRLKAILDSGELGELICIEGKYWQSSAAERALNPGLATNGWKADAKLAGEYDVFLDLGTHWADLMSYFFSTPPARASGWRSFANGQGDSRESHVNLLLEYLTPAGKLGRAMGSISKAVHGAANELEIHLLGTKGSASWAFLRPDEVVIGEGRHRRNIRRETHELGSGQSAHHGMGWLEGYIETSRRLIRDAYFGRPSNYPTTKGSLDIIDVLLQVAWNNE